MRGGDLVGVKKDLALIFRPTFTPLAGLRSILWSCSSHSRKRSTLTSAVGFGWRTLGNSPCHASMAFLPVAFGLFLPNAGMMWASIARLYDFTVFGRPRQSDHPTPRFDQIGNALATAGRDALAGIDLHRSLLAWMRALPIVHVGGRPMAIRRCRP